ncbi:MAG: LPS export ABC transporter periplasmic protein LptC [Pseudomonadota bacterium]|nr:LPS export ABC transporter periplasmic protein LptC [Pseudomonadota bacterium]
MPLITKHFFITLVSIFSSFSYCNEPNDLKFISVLDKPTFSVSSPERQIILKGESSSSLNGSEFTIQIPDLKLNSSKLLVSINSKEAIYNKNIGFIKFKDSAELEALNQKDKLIISSEEITLNLKNETFSSLQDVLTNLNDLEIKSLGMEMMQKAGNLHVEFGEGTFQIRNLGSICKGYAKKLYIISKDNKIILEEEALLDQDGFIIKSDLIHYDYSLNKILKSINSSIENNS